jgi:integrase
VPPTRMKRSKEHRVPLSARAVEIVRAQPRLADQPLVFPAPRGAAMSDMTLAAVIKRMHKGSVDSGGQGYLDPVTGRVATQHGFRSSFRDWSGEATSHQRELIEVALAHLPGNQTEAAYWRGDLMEKRRLLMADWAAYCGSKSTPGAEAPTSKQV